MMIVRYADDIVVGFAHEVDARRFWDAMRKNDDAKPQPSCRLLCWFLDASNNETVRTLSSPASKKRQGTKSREVWHRQVKSDDTAVTLIPTAS
ncbi:hypothetical protein [Bradyrhizobium sp. CCGUVB23]|uniref:hypothetical protein n=1 Tax=Bradyrhizobium sp. CCGUVB23 TaxID=2949630 RepID=UPI003531B4FC